MTQFKQGEPVTVTLKGTVLHEIGNPGEEGYVWVMIPKHGPTLVPEECVERG
jgi:hypothetical protein